jgi:hypothetical protein
MKEKPMARRRDQIKDLQRRMLALSAKDRDEVIRAVMMPAAKKLRTTLETWWKKPGPKDPRSIQRTIRAARRELEKEHAARRQAGRERARRT